MVEFRWKHGTWEMSAAAHADGKPGRDRLCGYNPILAVNPCFDSSGYPCWETSRDFYVAGSGAELLVAFLRKILIMIV